MKKKKQLFWLICILCLLYTSICTTALAVDDEVVGLQENSWRYYNENSIGNINSDVYSAQLSYISWSKVDGSFVNDIGSVIEGATKKGIDVSSYQGVIDWMKVKESDVDYAIIRCGYGDDYTQYDDSCWQTNANACTNLGIPFGTYIYSYAASIEEAQSEAAHVLRLVEGYDLSYPIYLDLEDDCISSLSTSKIGEIVQTFCSIIQEAGYNVGIYANKNWWTTKLTDTVFSNSSWYKWVAQYNSTCTYSGSYTMWQCTSSGSVGGINGNVDLNFWFGDDLTDYRKGDVNSDGDIDAADAGMILRYDVGYQLLTAQQLIEADVNSDGNVDAADAGMILRYDAGLSDL